MGRRGLRVAGDEKAAQTPPPPPVQEAKTTDTRAQTGSGAATDDKAAEKVSPPAPSKEDTGVADKDAPDPTEDRPDRAAREEKGNEHKGATSPKDDSQ